VEGENDPPVAFEDHYSTTDRDLLDVPAVGVLSNDEDVDSPQISATLVTDVVNGSLTWNGDGTFTYTHNGTQTSSDSFQYKANDGKPVSRSEATEFGRIFETRAVEIRSKILSVASL